MRHSRHPLIPRRVYPARILFFLYDTLVLGFSNRFVWQCPTERLLFLYNAHITPRHLEAGVGTGYFLDTCRFPAPPSKLVIIDRNAYTTAETAHRLARYRPVAYCRNLLEPLDIPEAPFDSIGFNYVLHCLPGSIASKAVVFEHLRNVMSPGAVLFGSTTLCHGVSKNIFARACMLAYNRLGIFSNLHDSLGDLQTVLAQLFSESSVTVAGCSGLFVCRR